MKRALSIAYASILMVALCCPLKAEEFQQFVGEITADQVNIRCDSTVNSAVIVTAQKGTIVTVVKEAFDWYKIRLPKSAPSYVKKNLVSLLSDKAAKIDKDVVNIRLGPAETFPIIGKARKDEVVTLQTTEGDWYKIDAIVNSYGWVNKKFVLKSSVQPSSVETDPAQTTAQGETPSAPLNAPAAVESASPPAGSISVEGVVYPYGKVLWRTATHKLITKDQTTYLLKGNKKTLNALNYHTVRITGVQNPIADKSGYPIVSIDKIEALD